MFSKLDRKVCITLICLKLCPLLLQTQLSDSELAMIVSSSGELQQCLQHSGQCAVCGGPFINSWLDCVQFVSIKKVSCTQHL